MIYLSDEVLRDLRTVVKAKYEGMYGLSAEVEEAIRAWLRLQHAQNRTHPLNPSRPFIHQVMDQIIFFLKAELNCLIQCSINDLKRAVANVRGADERTYRKWISLLLKEGRLKQIGTYLYEIV